MFRSNKDSLSRGAISSEAYFRGQKRSLVSLKICFIGWLCELFGVIIFIMTPFQTYIGFHYFQCIDVILMFIVNPLVYLVNDEDTKGVIAGQSWLKGFRYMIGILPAESQSTVHPKN